MSIHQYKVTISRTAWKQLQLLSTDDEKSAKDIVCELINAEIIKRGIVFTRNGENAFHEKRVYLKEDQ